MGSQSNLNCWEIMQCENPNGCPARMNPEKPCWEIANKSDDYRRANNICIDCIVHVLKADNHVLSKQDIKKAMKKKPIRQVVNWHMDIEGLQHECY
jgi:hypothetical protein